MTKVEIEKKLKAAGWTIVHGKRHDLAVKGALKVAIPRHTGDVPIGTAKKILKDAGVL